MTIEIELIAAERSYRTLRVMGGRLFGLGLGMRFLVSMDKLGQTLWANAKDTEVAGDDTRYRIEEWL